jgi:hypothetical protein
MDKYWFAKITAEEYLGYNPEKSSKHIEKCEREFKEIRIYFKPYLVRSVTIKEAVGCAAVENNLQMKHMNGWNYAILREKDNKRLAVLTQQKAIEFLHEYCKLSMPMSKQQRIQTKQRKFLEGVTKHLEDLLSWA